MAKLLSDDVIIHFPVMKVIFSIEICLRDFGGFRRTIVAKTTKVKLESISVLNLKFILIRDHSCMTSRP